MKFFILIFVIISQINIYGESIPFTRDVLLIVYGDNSDDLAGSVENGMKSDKMLTLSLASPHDRLMNQFKPADIANDKNILKRYGFITKKDAVITAAITLKEGNLTSKITGLDLAGSGNLFEFNLNADEKDKSVKKLIAKTSEQIITILNELKKVPETNLASYRAGLDKRGKLIITASKIRNLKGQLLFAVFDNKASFPDKDKEAVLSDAFPIDEAGQYLISDVPFGEYALIVCHDENGNYKFDFATEGFGISNNKPNAVGAPVYKDALFTVNLPETTLKIDFIY